MSKHNHDNYLLKRELQILKLLASGLTYKDISKTLGINLNCLYVHVHKMRCKTGISEPRDPAECREYLKDYSPRLAIPTPAQTKVLRMFAQNLTHQEISTQLECSKQTVSNALSEGFKRLGIRARKTQRMRELRGWLAAIDSGLGRPYDEMSDEAFS